MKEDNFNFNQIFLNTLNSGTSYPFRVSKAFLHLNNISVNISEKSFSILLAKASFAFLLLSMLSYWVQMSFKSETIPTCSEPLANCENLRSVQPRSGSPKTDRLLTPKRFVTPPATQALRTEAPFPLRGMGLRSFTPLPHPPKGERGLGSWRYGFFEKVPLVSMWSANITLALLLSIRWIESGHFPLSNLYESLIFLSWSLTVIHLFLENLFHKREESTATQYNLTLGAITAPVALFTNAFATFSLPQEMQKVTVLVPALKSNWLIMHVSVMIISYAALLSGSLLAMAFLVIQFIDANKIPSIIYTFINYVIQKRPLVAQLNFLPLRGTQMGLKSRTPKDSETLANSSFATSLLMRNKKLYPSAETLGYSPASDVFTQYVENHTPSYGSPEGVKGYTPQSKEKLAKQVSQPQGTRLCTEGEEQRGVIKHPLQSHLSGGVYPQKTKASSAGLHVPLARERGKEGTHYKQSVRRTCAAGEFEPLLLAERRSSIKENKVLEGSGVLDLSTKSMDLPEILDNLSYRSIGLGFALLTIGILSGAVWANEAWGSYWSWDPKETWAFITWLVFALYLHTRLSKGWVGKESAFVASFGFIVTWFCYLGVNLFGKGLHSYGWFQQ